MKTKRLVSTLTVGLLAISMTGQTIANGYYRIQNKKSTRYLSIYDKGDVRVSATQVDVSDLVGLGYKSGFARVEYDPSTVVYVKHFNGKEYDFEGQGYNTFTFTGFHVNIAATNTNSSDGTYWAYGTYAGTALYFADYPNNGLGTGNWADGKSILPGCAGASDTGKDHVKWNFRPVTTADGSDFGMKPTITIGSDYYLPFYASFPFNFLGSGMHAWYVTQIDEMLGVAVYKEVTGTIPGGVPLIVKCASSEPSQNKLQLLAPETSGSSTSGNLLKGVYWDAAGTYLHQSFTEYNPSTMRVLSVVDGKPAMVKADKTDASKISYHATHYYNGTTEGAARDLYSIPANTCYLPVSANCPDNLILMTEAEYAIYKQQASAVTLKADDKSRQYGEANPTFTYTVTEGTKNGGEPTLSCSATATSPVGTYPIVIAKGGVTNGTVNLQNGTLTVTKAPLKATAGNASRKYGAANPTFTINYSGFKNNENESVLTTKPTATTTATATSPVGNYDITVSGGVATNYDLSYEKGALTVTKAALTITARSFTIKQNEALPTFAADYSGFVNNETNSVLSTQPTITCNVPADKKPGTYPITVSGATAQNYDITYVAGTLTINEADPITVKAVSATMVYGDEVPQLTYTIEGGTLNGTPKVVCFATKTSDVGGYDITIDVSGIDYPNLKTVNGKLTITKAPLTVTAKSYTIVETEALPTFEATYSGWKNGQDAAVLTTQPTFTCNVPADKTPGSYPITVGGADAKNYSFTYTNGTLTITQAPTITIRAAAKTMIYGDDVPELTYTVEGGTLNGTPILATTATKTSSVGNYDITVERGDITYPRLNLVGAKLTVTKASLTITASSHTIKQTDALPTFTATYEGFKNGETEAVLTKKPMLTSNAPADKTPGTYQVTAADAEAQNYEITYVPGTLIITAADQIVVRADDVTLTYGESVPTQFTWKIEGTDETISGQPVITCDATGVAAVGTYVIKVEKGTINYPNVKLVNGTLTIKAAPLTIKAGSYTMKQNEQRPTFKPEFEGFVNNETEAVLTKQPVLTTDAPEDNKPGEYAVTVTGAEAQNYAITYVNGTLKISEADLITITAQNAEMTYGDAVPTLTFTVEGGTLNGTQPTVTCEATNKSDAGTYTIKVDTTGVDYPNLKLVDGTLTIGKAPLTVSVGNYERFQGEENPVFNLTYEGWRNDDTEDVLTVKPTVSCEATTDSPVGSYAITVSGGEAKNYSFTYQNGTLTVNEGQGIATLVLSRPADVYTTTGRKVRSQVTTLQGLPAGVYIVNGRKVIVK